MTARQLRDALAACPEDVLDQPVTWDSEYFLEAVLVEDGGLLRARHVVLAEGAQRMGTDRVLAATVWFSF